MGNDTRSKRNVAKKILKILFKVLYQILMILCVLLILIIVFQKVTDSNRSIGGYRIFRVITGSMVPEYDIGEVVISKEVPPQKIKVGDDIVYYGTYGDYYGKIIMHKVTEIEQNEDGSLTFHAKGLNTGSIEDPEIKESQIYGVVKLKSGILTVLYRLATSIYSSFIIITILVFNVFISFKFPGNVKAQQLEENDDSEEEYEEEYEDDSEEYDNEEDIDEEEYEEDSEEEEQE